VEFDSEEEEEGNAPHVFLHVGDLAYAGGRGYVWEQFMTNLEEVATRVPYMVSLGNHEYDISTDSPQDPSGVHSGFRPSWGNYGDDSNGECGLPVFARFHMPDNGFGPLWYSLNAGPIHISMLSSEHNFTKGSPQFLWLKNDLSLVNRAATPFVVVTSHRPMYASQNTTGHLPTNYDVSLHIRDELEDLLHDFGVDLVLAGHYHSYERTCPVFRAKCDPTGPTHVIVGTGGIEIGQAGWGLGENSKEWSKFHYQEFAYLRITADQHSLLGELVNIDSKSVADSFTLGARVSSLK